MKQLFTLMALAIASSTTQAQTDSSGNPAANSDTIRIGNIIINKSADKNEESKTINIKVFNNKRDKKLKNVSTNWFIVDFGFSNYSDQTNYANTSGYLYNRAGAAPLGAGDFDLNVGKSLNVNIWFFMQRLNLIKQHITLKYGLGLELNNYRYKSAISYLENNPFVTRQAPAPVIIRDSISFSKNKLAADYLTVPFMINYSSNPQSKNKGFSISLGVSAGYLYSQRNKQISDARGKQKNNGGFNLEQFKFSYIGELGLGPVCLYGSYAPNSFYKSGLDMRPYTLGIRLSNW